MVELKIGKDEDGGKLGFIRDALNYVCNIYDSCDGQSLFRMRKMFQEQLMVYQLNEDEAAGLNAIMQLYNDLSADFVQWSDELLQQLPCRSQNAILFYSAIKMYHLEGYMESLGPSTVSLFKYWLVDDWAYVNSMIISIMKTTNDINWLSLYSWCEQHKPARELKVMNAVNALKKLIGDSSDETDK